MKSHVIRVQNAVENDSLGLQNSLAIVYGPISTYTCSQRPHTPLQFSTRDFAHTRLHDFRVIIIIILLLLISRYRTSSSADFFTERLQFRRRCALTSSDVFFLSASHYSRSWSSSMVDTGRERRSERSRLFELKTSRRQRELIMFRATSEKAWAIYVTLPNSAI